MIFKMPPRRCVVQDCERIADLELGISVHGSPPSGSVLTKWKKFVLTHRKTFSLTSLAYVPCISQETVSLALYYFEHIDLIDVEKIRKEDQKFLS